jgi:acyl-coenzyme A thioesterase PaaI-like protein
MSKNPSDGSPSVHVTPTSHPTIQRHYATSFHNCFGCGPNNASGLQLRCWVDGDDAVARWTPLPHLEGPARALHGGITALLMDEVGSAAAFMEFHRRQGSTPGEAPAPFFVTATLSVDYLKPVPIDRELELRAHTTNPQDVESRKAWIKGVLTREGEVAATARLLFILTDAEKYDDTHTA